MDEKKYCFTIRTDRFAANDLVGEKALAYQKLQANNLNLVPSFVVSGFAFDDFIVANDLVTEIVNAIEAMAATPEKTNELSAKVQQLILQAEVPAAMQKQISEAYNQLGSPENTYLEVKQSALNSDLDITFRGVAPLKHNAKGLTELLTAIKQTWAQLFDPICVEYRQTSGYEGNLSQPVLVQKVLNPEVSGLLFNFELGSGAETLATVIANLGVSKQDALPALPRYKQPATTTKLGNNESDYYELNKAGQKVLKQLNQVQKFMQIRSRPGAATLLTEVKISKVWSERPKLTEEQLKKLTSILNLIDKHQASKFVCEWVYESGQYTLVDFTALTEELASHYPPIHWPEPKQTGKISLTKKITESEASNEAKLQSATPTEPVVLPEPEPTPTPKAEALNYLKQQQQDIELSPKQRADKAKSVKEMVPEIKTVTEVWWDVKIDVSELKVFLNNIEGYGIFTISQVAAELNASENVGRLKELKSLQKQICEYLATYLTAISPKPVFLQFERELNFEAQVDIISQLRNLYGHKNIWAIMPELRDLEEIAYFKKILASNGFRRTNVFQVFQLVSQPLYLANLTELVNQNIDGIVLDVDQIYQNLIGSKVENNPIASNYELLLNFLIDNLIEKSQTKLFTYLKTSSSSLLDKLLGEMLENGINGIIYQGEDLFDFKQKLTEQETHILTKSLKRIKKSLTRA